MGRAADWRDEAASGLVLRHLPALGVGGGFLVMEDPRPDVARMLEERGHAVTVWHRRAVGGRPASPWPPEGPFETVLLRLPRAKEELEMLGHAAAARLASGGRLLVYGAKDEGAGSAGSRLEPVFSAVESVATGGRCRLVQALGPLPDRARGRAEDWRSTFALRLPGGEERDWVSWPGLFAHGRLDDGTALLLDVLDDPPPGATVLDFGCGDGVIAGALEARVDGLAFHLLDVDALALRAAAENVPGATTVLGDGIAAAPRVFYDLLVSNPPFHRGKEETLGVVRDLIAGASTRLAPGGRLTLVVQRRLPVGADLASVFRRVDVLADRGPYRVWEAKA